MQIVHTDLDNTLIYSYKHEIGGPKTCVEIYQGREISFMTETSHRLLGQLCSKPGVLVVPTTTRTLEQYQRIDLGIGVPEYALVCNGGVLLHQGKEDLPELPGALLHVAVDRLVSGILSIDRRCAERITKSRTVDDRGCKPML